GYGRVLEVGCGDGTGARIVEPVVDELCGIDIDDELLSSVPQQMTVYWHDILQSPFITGGMWDAAYALDVLEHIPPEREDIFFNNINAGLRRGGVVIIGSPSLESQPYASEPSIKGGHVNCKTEEELRNTLLRHFRHVFIFGMNDGTLHTGFGPM